MTRITTILFLALAVGLFATCRNDGKEQHNLTMHDKIIKQDVRLAPGNYLADNPGNINEY